MKDAKELLSRQESITELKEKINWRQYFQGTGRLTVENSETSTDLLSWAKENQALFNNWFYRIMLVLTPLIGITVITLISLNIVGFGAFVVFLFLPFLIIGPKIATINREHGQLSRKSSILNTYGDLLHLIENESFQSELLNEAKKKLVSGDDSAATAIKNLSKISNAFDYRLNFLVGIVLNVFFLWDID